MYQCDINIILILNPKYSTVPAIKRKINSILAETRTLSPESMQTIWPAYNTFVSGLCPCWCCFSVLYIVSMWMECGPGHGVRYIVSTWAWLRAGDGKVCMGNVRAGNGTQCVAHWLIFGKSKAGLCPKHAFFKMTCPAVSESEVHCVKCPALSLVFSKWLLGLLPWGVMCTQCHQVGRAWCGASYTEFTGTVWVLTWDLSFCSETRDLLGVCYVSGFTHRRCM